MQVGCGGRVGSGAMVVSGARATLCEQCKCDDNEYCRCDAAAAETGENGDGFFHPRGRYQAPLYLLHLSVSLLFPSRSHLRLRSGTARPPSIVQPADTYWVKQLSIKKLSVANIDVKVDMPVAHGEIICFSIYSGPQANFGNCRSCVWVDVLDGEKDVLKEFVPFFEDSSIKKVVLFGSLIISRC
ncbi:hypothetical protein B296_00043590 [Ensete ventricosum]|uniref:Uncharacterized protein n=1 Tax=Ensete ventricosum TaxID=4639 RepID=A0A426XMA2_ENSVE|nr:hypothetical protein B296_00043590 [Ensete ventricosum]